MTYKIDPPFWCPWCETVITDETGYDHAYQHQDKGEYAVDVEELLSEHNAVETFQTLDDETLDELNVCRYCLREYHECICPEATEEA